MSEKDVEREPQQARDIFLAALEVEEAGRLEFLKRNCQGDQSLFDEVRSLLGHANLQHDPLEKGLDSDEFTGAHQAASQDLQLRCPQCSSTINLNDNDDLTSVECSSCKSSINVLGENGVRDSRSDNRVDQRIGRYRLLEKIGAGAGGTVWLAQDEELHRGVAIKFPHQSRLGAADRERFLREARAAGRFQHPNLVAVYEIGWDQDALFIVSEFIDGSSLKEWSQENGLDISQAVEAVTTLAEALDFAHEHGVIHRDLKPQNILMDETGTPHITDFGLAKSESDDFTMTLEGQLMGTPAYMSPEQAAGGGHRVDRRGDIYSLGVILYELITGECPFRGTTEMLIKQVLQDEPLEPRRLNARVSRDLNTVCLKCLQKNPGSRYQTAAELSNDLVSIQKGLAVRARPVSQLEKSWRWCRRNPLSASLGACLILLLLTLSIVGPIVAFRQSELARQASVSEASATRESKAARTAQRQAERNARTAKAHRLARESELISTRRPNRSALLALAAVQLKHSQNEPIPPEVMSSLHVASLNLGLPCSSFGFGRFCFSADGKQMYTVARDGIWRWNLTDESPEKTRKQVSSANYWFLTKNPVPADVRRNRNLNLATNDADVQEIFLSADGRFLYLVFQRRQALARIDLDAQQPGEEIQLVEDYKESRFFVASSGRNSKRFAIAVENEVTIWDRTSAEPKPWKLSLPSPFGEITELKFSPNARWLVAAVKDKTVRLWDLSKSRLGDTPTILATGEAAEQLTISLDNRWIAWTTESSVCIADLEKTVGDERVTRLQLPTRSGGRHWRANSIALNLNHIIAGCIDGQTRIWNLNDESPESSLRVAQGRDEVAAVAIAPGLWFMTLEPDHRVARVWQFRRSGPQEVGQFYYDDEYGITMGGHVGLVYSPNSDWIVLTKSGRGRGLWPIGKSGQLAVPHVLLAHSGVIRNLEFSRDGQFLYSSGWSTISRLETDQLVPNRTVRTAFGKDFLLDSGGEFYLRTFRGLLPFDFRNSGDTNRDLIELDKNEKMVSSPDGQWCFIGTSTGAIRQVRLGPMHTLREEPSLQGHGKRITCLSISQNSRWLVSASDDRTIRLWDLSSKNIGESSRVIGETDEVIRDFAISPDGRWGYAINFGPNISSGKTRDLLDLRNQTWIELNADWQYSGSAGRGLFSNDGRWFVSDGVLWDLATDQSNLRSFPLGHLNEIQLTQPSRVASLAFSPDNSRVAVSDLAGDVQVWDLSSIDDSLVAAPRCLTILKHPKTVTSAAFHPDGELLATGSSDSLIRVWDLNVVRLINDVQARCGRELTHKERVQFQVD